MKKNATSNSDVQAGRVLVNNSGEPGKPVDSSRCTDQEASTELELTLEIEVLEERIAPFKTRNRCGTFCTTIGSPMV